MFLKRYYESSSGKLKRCSEKYTIAKEGKQEFSYSEIVTIMYKYKFLMNKGVFKYNLHNHKSILVFKER